jgi:Na+-translocating ferredoxin:NAD+ oxidoreductase subunit B
MAKNIDAAAIDALLPQTQCGQCGFGGCLPYAQAISQDTAPINQCPPGGQTGIDRLAALLDIPSMPLNPQFGSEQPRMIAVIDEQHCIGCTKCLPPCPTDAIVGAPKLMHSVITALCTGCALCVAPCPVDCISMQPAEQPDWSTAQADEARRRYRAKQTRLARLAEQQAARFERQKQLLAKAANADS